ncbi:hypothetical protein [Pontibacter populi]|uniref:ER-bound oxygenase mpaB/mpaB'/Rubber oxygenase catalytic domain-containing protein n=1 Tax=Pontibacter populi TaxID=890055 RepID=A0ABV1RXW7_9BACT
MEDFVENDSVVRQIWVKGDAILLILAGAAAEFALNKAVDWLFFTGHLPSDPLGRLFSTVSYACRIVFSPKKDALRTIDAMASIHAGVEAKRGIKYQTGLTATYSSCSSTTPSGHMSFWNEN